MPELDARGQVALKPRTLNVSIPRGIVAGQRIRLSGQGARGPGGGPAGDLYLEVEFEPQRRFRAEGHDIYAVVPITPWEAALGARIPVATLGGTVDVSVPAGAQSGQKLRLKGRGLPGKPSGDHYVELRMVTPPAGDADARELYRCMAEQFSFDPRRETTAS
jgi:curved DNA-binding protein